MFLRFLKKKFANSEWYLDGRCLRLIITNTNKLITIEYKNKNNVSFKDDDECKSEYNTIEINSDFIIMKVLLVNNMHVNLLSVRQLYDLGYRVEFISTKCLLKHLHSNNKTILIS